MQRYLICVPRWPFFVADSFLFLFELCQNHQNALHTRWMKIKVKVENKERDRDREKEIFIAFVKCLIDEKTYYSPE